MIGDDGLGAKVDLGVKLAEELTGLFDLTLEDLLKLFLLLNLLGFFSITTEFLLWVLANSIFSIDFFAMPDSVNFVF